MSSSGRLVLVCIAALLVGALVPCQAAQGADSAARDSRITGTVTSGQTGPPVPGVWLRLSPLGASAVSDERGAYAFDSIPAGTYALSAQRTGFWARGDLVAVVAGEAEHQVDIALQPRLWVFDEIVVSASRVDEPRAGAAEQVRVLESGDIREKGAHDVAEALLGVPGLVVERNLGPGSNAYPSIRGSQQRHVLSVMDGIPLNSLVEGTADLSWVPVEQVDRVEIVTGASSATWGSSLGGVVHIATKPAGASGALRVIPQLSLGSWDARRGGLSVEGGLGSMGLFATSSLFRTDGFRPETDVDSRAFFGKVGVPLGDGASTALMVGHSSGEVGDGAFPDRGIWSSHEYETSYGALSADSLSLLGAEVQFDLGAVAQRYLLFGFPLGSADPLFEQEAKERRLCLSARAVWARGGLLRWTSGIDANWGHLDAESAGGQREITQRAAFTSLDLHKGGGTCSLGLRFDHDSPFGSQLSPTVGGVYEIPGWRTVLRASCSRDFNSPLLSMRFFEDPRRGLLANPDIKPELAWVYQTSVEVQPLPFLWNRCSVYRSDNRNAIGMFVDPANNLAMMKNFSHRRSQGGELEVKAMLPSGLWASAAAAFNDVRELPSDASFWALTEGEVVKDRPRVVYDIGMGYRGNRGPHVSLLGEYIWWNAPQEYKADDRKLIWNARASQAISELPFGSVEAFVAVQNVFDTPYSGIYVYPRPGRAFEGGLRCIL